MNRFKKCVAKFTQRFYDFFQELTTNLTLSQNELGKQYFISKITEFSKNNRLLNPTEGSYIKICFGTIRCIVIWWDGQIYRKQWKESAIMKSWISRFKLCFWRSCSNWCFCQNKWLDLKSSMKNIVSKKYRNTFVTFGPQWNVGGRQCQTCTD